MSNTNSLQPSARNDALHINQSKRNRRLPFRTAVAMILVTVLVLTLFPMSVFAAGKTGVGMAEWALRAYNEGWKYQYGGSEVGSIDCSGLIRSYTGGGGGALAQLNASSKSGSASSIPNIHGLGLWCDGHAGVYVGKNDSGTNMAVDARNSRVNVVYSEMTSRTYNPWVKWFKIKGVSYPTNGWVDFNGNRYYYSGGSFVTGVYEVDGTYYDFGKSGALIGKTSPTKATTTTTTAKPTTTTTKKTSAKTTTKTPEATTTAKKTTTTKKTTAPTEKSLRMGMSGDRVTQVQQRLIELGYLDSEVTGYYGEQTAKAVQKFQRAVGLSDDGVAGGSTIEKLFASDAPSRATKATTAKKTTAATTTKPTEKSLRMGMSGDRVAQVQERLIELGYLDSEVTGYYGEQTAKAVQRFQRAVGLSDDGVAGGITIDKLFASDAPSRTTTTKSTTTKTTTTTTAATTTSTATTVDKTGKTTTTTEPSKATQEGTSTAVSNTTAVTDADKVTDPTLPDEEQIIYEELSFGSAGEAVKQLQKRLSELGYYDQSITDYYGVFLRIAVMNFQLGVGLPTTGVADNETQVRIYSEDAEQAGHQLSVEDIYGSDLDEDGGDYFDTQEVSGADAATAGANDTVELEPSNGLDSYSGRADIVAFINAYGDAGALQTLGVFTYSTPEVKIYRDGASYSLSDELDKALEDCVFN